MYTYKIVNLAAWAERSDIQQSFSDIRATVTGASKMNQTIGLQLTNDGWEVVGQ
jgi:phage baseplate assembly protein W